MGSARSTHIDYVCFPFELSAQIQPLDVAFEWIILKLAALSNKVESQHVTSSLQLVNRYQNTK
jgi:hypothetical protein